MEWRYEWARDGFARCKLGNFEAGVSGEKEVGGMWKPS